MPNGKGDPQCFYCANYISQPNRKNCKKHDFVLPEIGLEPICCDFLFEGQIPSIREYTKSKEFLSLESDYLYYVSNKTIKFDKFINLNNLIVGVHIHNDQEFGWTIYIADQHHEYFPVLQEKTTIVINGKQYEAKIVDVKRERMAAPSRNWYGKWKQVSKMFNQRVIYFPEEPDILYKWVNKYFDIKKILNEISQYKFPFGIFADIEIIESNKLLRMRPSFENYEDHIRR